MARVIWYFQPCDTIQNGNLPQRRILYTVQCPNLATCNKKVGYSWSRLDSVKNHKKFVVSNTSIWTPVKNVVPCSTFQSWHVFQQILYRVTRVKWGSVTCFPTVYNASVSTRVTSFVTARQASIFRRFTTNFVQCHKCEFVFRAMRVKMDSCPKNMCTVWHVSESTRLTTKFVQRNTCQIWHVSHKFCSLWHVSIFHVANFYVKYATCLIYTVLCTVFLRICSETYGTVCTTLL